MTYKSYLRERLNPYKSELRIFPLADETTTDELEDFEDTLLQDRFRWLRLFYSLVDSQDLLGYWLDSEAYAKERQTFIDEPFDEFMRRSCTFGMKMLRDEIRMFPYFSALRKSLRSRLNKEDPVLVMGPTAGGEVEAVHAACGAAYLHGDLNSVSCYQAESRLFSDRIPFESIGNVFERPEDTRYVVLSPYLNEDVEYVRLAYDLVGLYGYLACPSECIKLTEEMESLGLYQLDTWNEDLSLFYKYPGLPLRIGD
jgi:hypothetical protein